MSVKITPDLYALTVFAGALLLEWLWPINLLPAASFTSLHSWLGAALAVGGFAIEAGAGMALSAARTATKPFAAPSALVMTGPFGWSRNPLYCGMLLILIGVSAALSVEWGMILTPFLWLALDRFVIPAEEAALSAAFPDAWRDYVARTPRWIGFRR
jgi:protein-S-isoprenylcysteine O-methyltransferase Ste14